MSARRDQVLFLHPSDEMYGADRSLAWLVRSSVEQAAPIVLLPDDLAYEGRLSGTLRAEGHAVHRGPLPVLRRRYLRLTQLPWFALRLIRGIAWVVRTGRRAGASAIVSNTSAIVAGPIAARLLGIPHVWYIREIIERPVWFRRLFRLLAMTSQGTVVAVSEAVASWIGPLPDRGPVVLYNGVDLDDQPTGLPDRPAALFVGRINAWKGQELFVQAAAIAHEDVPTARFRLVGGTVPGDETHERSLNQAIIRAGEPGDWLSWDGEVADTRAAMKDAWVVVVPSLQPDPLPNVVLEAMAQGRAVIGSRLGGIPEMVDDGVTGVLVDPGDEKELAAALAQVLQSRELAERYGSGGRARAEATFTRERLRQAWRGLLASTLPREVPRGR
jgi:glycosyltransferase involved in cell wall biosynthesis